jgi:hypothetical protein
VTSVEVRDHIAPLRGKRDSRSVPHFLLYPRILANLDPGWRH